MDKNKLKILIIATVVFVAIPILLGVGVWISESSRTPPPKTNTYTDSVSGEKVVDVEGKSPEAAVDGTTTPAMYGLSNIQPYFGDDFAFHIFREVILRAQYKDEKVIKISKDNIVRNSTVIDGITIINIEFDYYLNNQDSSDKKYHSRVSYNQNEALIKVTFIDPAGKTETRQEYVFGED